MHIITCASSKGGVGKSTTCVCLAGAFAKAGDAVHIIDLDSNGTVSRWLGDDSLRPRAITVSSPAPADLNQHLKKLSAPNGPDMVFIDVAGAYEKTLAYAIANAHLTLIPASLSEADLFEAHKVARFAMDLARKIGRAPVFRLLLTKVQPLQSTAQRYALKELERLQMPMLSSFLVHRAAYEEIGLTGLPPHYADSKRETVTKAVEELDRLVAEIKSIIQPDEVSTTPTTRKSNVA